MDFKKYHLLLFLFLLVYGRAGAQCADNCVNATPLTVTANGPCNYVLCNNLTATPSGVNPGPCSGVNNNDVWYSFTVPAGVTTLIGQVQGGTAASGYMEYPIIYFYRGGCGVLNNLGCNTGNPPGSTASLLYSGFIPGETILVRVKPLGGTSDGNFQLCVYNPCPSGPPANDNPCGATVLPMSAGSCSSFVNIANFCATPTTGPATPSCGFYSGNDVWVQTTVGANGHLAVSCQAQSLFNPAAAIYTGTCSSLTEVACDDDGGGNLMPYLFVTSLAPGSTAWIRIWASGSTSNTGTVGICLFDPCPGGAASNDDPCSATVVPMVATCSTYTSISTFCASATSGVANPLCGFYSGGDVWVRTTVPSTGHIAASFQAGTLQDPAAAIYTGTCSSLTEVACDDNSGTWPLPYMYVTGLTPGATAWIRIWSANGTNNGGTVGICLHDPCPGGGPPGDDPCSAVPVTLSAFPCSTFTTLTNVCAGGSTGVPPPGCASYAGGDVWVTTTSPSGRLEVNFQQLSLSDCGAAVYTGTCNSLTLLACDDDGGPGLMPYLYYNSGTPNTTYWIRIWAYAGFSTGTTSVCLTDPCPSNTLTPPLYDDPLAMCPVPPAVSQLPVTNGSCTNYITLNSICASSSVSTVPAGVPVPVNCGPGYPAGAFTGWDVWSTVVIPTTPPIAYIDFNTQYGTLYNIDMAVYRVNSPVATNCSNGSAYNLISCADAGGPGSMPYLHLPYGGSNTLQPGDTLFVRQWSYFGGPAGDWGICVNITCPGGAVALPAYNDPPCPSTATLLPVTGGTCVNFQHADIDNCLTATPSNLAPAPTCAYWNNSNDLWFVVQMPTGGSGQLDFNWEQGLSLNDGGMAIYSGLPTACGGTGLTQIACDDDAGGNFKPYISSTNPVGPGQYLFVRCWGYGGYNTGTIGLCVSDPCPSQPPNDLRCNATNLTVGNTCNFTTYPIICANSIDNVGVPPPGCGWPNPTTGTGPGRDIWFSFTAPTSGSVIIDTREGTLNNVDMALYHSSSGNDCQAGFVLVACDDNTGLGEMPYLSLSNLTPGLTYFLRCWEHGNDQDGNFSLCIFNPCPTGSPANDGICNSTFISLNNSIIGNNNCARFDQGINNPTAPPPSCWINVPPFNNNANMNTSWYKTTGSSVYTILVTPNTLARPQVAVYSGATCGLITSSQLRSCDAGLPGGCKSMPNASLIEITGMIATDTVFIAVEGVDNRMGSFEIAVYNTLLSGIHAVQFLDCRQAVPVCNAVTSVANPGRIGSGNHCDLGTGFSYKAFESAPGAHCALASSTVTVNSTTKLSVGMSVAASGGGTFFPGTRVISIANDSEFVISTPPQIALSSANSVVYGYIDPSYVSQSNAISSGSTITVNNTAGLYAGMSVTSAGGTGGNFPAATTVTSILSSTQFTVNNAPVPAFSGATVVTGTRYDVDNRYPEANASWYFFSTTATPGDLTFDINSPSLTNYDFVLWELGGAASTPGYFTGLSTGNDSTVCTLIKNATGYGLPVRTNVYHASVGSTGLSTAYTSDAAYSAPVASTGVHTYVLVIMNTEGNSLGYTLDFGSSPIDYTTPSVVWNGGAGSNDWFNSANWGDCAVPQCNISAIVVGGLSNQPEITSNASVNNLTVQAGSSLTVDSGVTLIVCGNFNNSGVFRMGPNSLVKFAGQTSQDINGNFNGLNQFENVTVEKPVSSPVTLNVNADIGGTLRISTNQSVLDATGRYIRLGGDFFNANGMSSFIGQSGTTLEMNGTGVQTFTNLRNGGPGAFYINNVVVNQQDPFNDYVELSPISGGTIDNNLRIGSTLNLISGKIFTNQWEVYSLSSQPGSVSGGNDYSYIEGVHSRNVARASSTNTPYEFAVGMGGSMEYAGLIKAASGSTTDTIKLRASFHSWPGGPIPHGPVSNECQGADWSLFEAYDHGYWTIDSLNSSGPAIGPYTLNLRPATIVSNNNGSASWSIMKRSPSGTGTWAMDGTCRTGPVFSSAYDVYRDSMSGFSDFAITQYNVAIVGLHHPSGQALVVYPSATHGPVRVLAGPAFLAAEYSITDVCGKQVLSGRLAGEQSIVDLSDLAPGMYFLKLHEAGGHVVKLLKY